VDSIRNIETFDEASNNMRHVAPAFAAQYDDILWQVICAMTHRISHGYD
jgi:hypothetical protein